MIYDALYHVGVVLSSMVVGALIYRFGLRSQSLRQILSPMIYGGEKGGGMSDIAIENLNKSDKDDKGGGAEINWGDGT